MIKRSAASIVEEEALCAATDEALEAMLPILKRYRERLQALFPNEVGEEDLETAIEFCGQALEAMTDVRFDDESSSDG
jgi:hypothetical protein